MGTGLAGAGLWSSSLMLRRCTPEGLVTGCGLGELLPDHVGIDPERDRRIGVSQPGRHHMDRHASPQECRGVNVAQIVKPGSR